MGPRMRIISPLVLTAALTVGTAWADSAAETATALQYVYKAAQADKIADIHANLHQAVNCLVGPKDSLFDKSQPNPCAKSGSGVIATTKDPKLKKHLQDAVDMAEMAIATDDPDNAMMLATGAAGALRASEEARSHP